MSKLPQIKTMVATVLEEHPYTRDSDQLLMEKVWEIYYDIKAKPKSFGIGKVLVIDIDLFRKLPNRDDVKRIRAKFNQTGLYISSDPEVRAKRNMSEEKYLQFLGYR